MQTVLPEMFSYVLICRDKQNHAKGNHVVYGMCVCVCLCVCVCVCMCVCACACVCVCVVGGLPLGCGLLVFACVSGAIV